jgi:NADPH:quinone reductase-like Zn-dependent oxidoreductase
LVNVTSQYLTEIARLVDGGKLRTNVGAVLPLAGAREAHFMLERVRPQPKGKIVLAVEASWLAALAGHAAKPHSCF